MTRTHTNVGTVYHLSSESNLKGVHHTSADDALFGIYHNWVHQNNGTHLDGVIDDNSKWKVIRKKCV